MKNKTTQSAYCQCKPTGSYNSVGICVECKKPPIDEIVIKEYNKMMLKKTVYNTCIDTAISKAKLSATLLPVDEIQDIIQQLEKYKK